MLANGDVIYSTDLIVKLGSGEEGERQAEVSDCQMLLLLLIDTIFFLWYMIAARGKRPVVTVHAGLGFHRC